MSTKNPDAFYLQDSRSYVGNDMLFWAKDSKGYTTDLRNAHVFTREQAQRRHDHRETDIPWPKDYIDARTRPAIDFQHVDRHQALMNSGITIKEPKPEKFEPVNCRGCGRFLSRFEVFHPCPCCGTEYYE